jgi:enoyl-CoA hydratase
VSDVLRVENKDGAIAVVTLSRPDRLNAIGSDTLAALADALADLESDDAVRAFVITGEGRAFCAGADIDELSRLEGAAGFARFVRTFTDVLDRLEQHAKPSIAAIDGAALGGGLELALACDLRVAADRARLGVPEIKLGLLPGAGGTQRLPRLLPRGVALQMLLTGAPLDALEAHRLGLVNELSGDAPALATAERLAREIATGPPLAHAAAKHLVQRGALLELADAIALERDTVAELFATDDAAEGLAAFRAKRSPTFRGR